MQMPLPSFITDAPDGRLTPEMVVENGYWVVRVTASDASVHLVRSPEDWQALKAAYGDTSTPPAAPAASDDDTTPPAS